ncbi:hypothetical protein DERP_002851 [Dermatophagoides pteronyssinus]|uniref:Uncharacterized protein n=1 Tax=Dermatophagoides pteronyssinus TaxID=6956 RepID=A0ABQ8JVW6_DERPT|nr:hypothetical protein DERP_002851 [Dermatophagoides pteronyssinus]
MEKKGPAKKDTAIDPLQCERKHCRMYRIKIKGKSDLLDVIGLWLMTCYNKVPYYHCKNDQSQLKQTKQNKNNRKKYIIDHHRYFMDIILIK